MLSNRCRNLFSHDDIGPAGTDEVEEDRPEVPFVRLSFLLAGDGEGLTGAGAGPQWLIVRPSSKSSCIGPPANPGEEVALGIASEIVRSDINYAPVVNITRRDKAC
jgi:hypothetical protein